MDLLEYVAQQIKRGKKPAEIRQLLVQNGYPVYEVENALSVAESKDDAKKAGVRIPLKLPVNVPGYVVMLAVSAVLLVAGIVALVLYVK